RSTSAQTPIDTGLRTPALEGKIRARAYEIYEQRGWDEGHNIDDWLQAEAEVTNREALQCEPIITFPRRRRAIHARLWLQIEGDPSGAITLNS
ncbi:MAG TPA: DUF2934 domain-containing protein, partial [Terriglobales bacterium]|nr:DUF2934 domain-containing protein [Terriglobales bacterium]